VDKKLKEFFIRPPLTLTNRLRFVTPHALAAPQFPDWIDLHNYSAMMLMLLDE